MSVLEHREDSVWLKVGGVVDVDGDKALSECHSVSFLDAVSVGSEFSSSCHVDIEYVHDPVYWLDDHVKEEERKEHGSLLSTFHFKILIFESEVSSNIDVLIDKAEGKESNVELDKTHNNVLDKVTIFPMGKFVSNNREDLHSSSLIVIFVVTL